MMRLFNDKAFTYLLLLCVSYTLVACTGAELAINMYQDCAYRNNRDGLCIPGVTHVAEWLDAGQQKN